MVQKQTWQASVEAPFQVRAAVRTAPASRRVDVGVARAQHKASVSRHLRRPWELAHPSGGKDEPSWPWAPADNGLVDDAGFGDVSDGRVHCSGAPDCGSFDDTASPESGENRTTLMVQRIAPNKTEADVQAELLRHGFGGAFDIVYLPLNRKRTANLGYAFVNFHKAAGADACLRALSNQALGDLTSHRPCRVAYSKMQGDEFLQHVAPARAGGERKVAQAPALANSEDMRLMHPSVAGTDCGIQDQKHMRQRKLTPPPGLFLPRLCSTPMMSSPAVFPGAIVCGAPISL